MCAVLFSLLFNGCFGGKIGLHNTLNEFRRLGFYQCHSSLSGFRNFLRPRIIKVNQPLAVKQKITLLCILFLKERQVKG